MLRSTMNRGFQLTFKNSWTISVQFGVTNYCSNRDHAAPFFKYMGQEITVCKNAEIAIWCNHNSYRRFEQANDDKLGYVTSDEVAQWITLASELDPCRSCSPITIEAMQ